MLQDSDNMKTQSITINLPLPLVEAIDKCAADEYTTRTEVLKRIILAWLGDLTARKNKAL